MPLTDTMRQAAAKLVQRYPVARSALLPLLHLVQADQGRITEEGIAFCADLLDLTKAEVGAVVTFYTMFKREPVGDWLLSVCTNPPCELAGAGGIYARYRERLGGHHDDEAGVTVEHAECLGICDAAPVVQVNYEMFGPLDDEEADELLDRVMDGRPPASNWSGEVPPTFREISWELSGAADGLDEEWIAAARQQVAEYEVPPAYRTGETDLPVTHAGGDPRGHGGEAFRAAGGAAPGSMARAEGAMPAGPPAATAAAAAGSAPDEPGADQQPADEDEAGEQEPAAEPAEPGMQAATGGVDGSQPGGVATPLNVAPTGPAGDAGDGAAGAEAPGEPGAAEPGEAVEDADVAEQGGGIAGERAETGPDVPDTPADAAEPDSAAGSGDTDAPVDAADRDDDATAAGSTDAPEDDAADRDGTGGGDDPDGNDTDATGEEA